MSLPAGTVTFLFTDIEGSTRLLQQLGEDYRHLLERHAGIVREAVDDHDGTEVSTEGDAFFCVFPTAPEAVQAAVAAQRALAGEEWPQGQAVKVRMGLHTGRALLGADDYVGIDVHRAARVASAGHGGQVLLSDATRALVANDLPSGVELRDLGRHRLKDLSQPEHIHQLLISGLQSDFPPIRTLEVTPNNLPVQLTSFVGRQDELREIRQLLSSSRLLTLTGPGGTGKTRLALQAGAEVAEDFPDGVFFVALAGVDDHEKVGSAIVSALELPLVTGRPLDRVIEFLRTRRVLLILDNFEQVLEAAGQISELLRSSEHPKALVTSRAPLRISGEQEYPVPPLRTPTPGLKADELLRFESVSLFVERAASAKPNFSLTDDNAEAVGEIATRLEGLPLALELAAARVRLLPPKAIKDRLADRLSLLSGGPRDLPTRQQTLRDAIAWSYDLLDEPGKLLLERMGVFSGGARLEEIESVCGEGLEAGVLEGLGLLVEQSMLRQEEVHDEGRFLMLETIREFALEKLHGRGEEREIGRRHAVAYLRLAESAEPHLLSWEQKTWLDQLEREIANLRGALTWLVEQGEGDQAQRLASALWRFWQIRGYLLEGAGHLERVLAMGGSSESRAGALEAAGGVAYWRGDAEAAHRFYSEALEVARELGEEAGIAEALYNLGFALMYVERVEEAEELLQESLRIARDIDDRAGIAKALWGLAGLGFVRRDLEGVKERTRESLAHFEELDDPFGIAWARFTLGSADAELGNWESARDQLEVSLKMFAEIGDISGVVIHLGTLAQVALGRGDEERAVRLLAAMNELGRSSGTMLIFKMAEVEAESLGRAIQELMPRIHEAEEDVKGISLEQAVEMALTGYRR